MPQGPEIVHLPSLRRHKLAAWLIGISGLLVPAGLIYGDVQGFQWAIDKGHARLGPLAPARRLSSAEYSSRSDLGNAVQALQAKFGSHLPSPSEAQSALRADKQFKSYNVYLVKDAFEARSTESYDRGYELDVQIYSPRGLTLLSPDYSGKYVVEALYRPERPPVYSDLVMRDGKGPMALMVLAAIAGAILSVVALVLSIGSADKRLHRWRSLRAWRRLVSSPLLGPQEPTDGFSLVHPEKESRLDQSGQEHVRFIARRYRFSLKEGQWQDKDEEVALTGRWAEATGVSEVVGDWVEFCNAVARHNVKSWTVQSGAVGAKDVDAVQGQALGVSVAALLPDPRQVVDLGLAQD